MTTERDAIGRVLFAISVPLMVLALICFVLPVLGVFSGSYRDGSDGFVLLFLYLLFAAPAGLLLLIGTWLVGWKKARFAKISFAVLFVLPVAIGVLGFVWMATLGDKRPQRPEPVRAMQP